MIELKDLPMIARLNDYIGPWSVEPTAFAVIWQAAESMDLAAHIRETTPPPRAAAEKLPGPVGQQIAVVKLTGPMMKGRSSLGGTSTIDARREIRAAAADPDVAGILLAIESPGGTVAGTDDLAREVQAAAKAKPVWAHIDDLGASAAYWVASQTSRITANSPTAQIGSIGTFTVIYDSSAAAQQEGVKALLFATGSLKGLGTPGSQVTDEQISHVQGLIDSVQSVFDAAVMQGRKLSASQLAGVRHGGTMTAPSALNARLIDAIQPLGTTLSEFADALRPQEQRSRRAESDGPVADLAGFPAPMLE